MYDRQLMTDRPWSWLRHHILGLLGCDTQLRHHIFPPKQQPRRPSDDG